MDNRIFAINTSILENPETFDAYYKKMRPDRRERIDRMRFDTGKRLRLGAGIVMEAALSYAGCQDREILVTPQGKPVVDGCYFNISDAGEVAVCAVSDREVGIDIERPRELKEALIERAFTPAEIRAAGGDPDYFIRLWTVKESVMKWYGMGLGLMPERIEVEVDPAAAGAAAGDLGIAAAGFRVSIEGDLPLATPPAELHFTGFRYEDYHITVCSTDERFTDSISWIDE